MLEAPRITSADASFNVDNHRVTMTLYTAFKGDETELWFYGTGVAETAIIQQCGDSFLSLVDADEDPSLGKIIVSAGTSWTAYMAPRGDWNLRWHWNYVDWLNRDFMDKYDLHLCTCHSMLDKYIDKGYPSTLFLFGVGRFFKPLHLPRSGYGYSGLRDIHHPDEVNIVLGPFMDDPLMELKLFTTGDPILSLSDYNRWLNTKQLVFSMLTKSYQVVSSRAFDALASGSPLIISRNDGVDPTFGFHFPYQTSSREETLKHFDSLMKDYPETLKEFEGISAVMHERHSYELRLRELFKVLQEMK